jgi:hypothetical protein
VETKSHSVIVGGHRAGAGNREPLKPENHFFSLAPFQAEPPANMEGNCAGCHCATLSQIKESPPQSVHLGRKVRQHHHFQ